jgi:hypothetical protein
MRVCARMRTAAQLHRGARPPHFPRVNGSGAAARAADYSCEGCGARRGALSGMRRLTPRPAAPPSTSCAAAPVRAAHPLRAAPARAPGILVETLPPRLGRLRRRRLDLHRCVRWRTRCACVRAAGGRCAGSRRSASALRPRRALFADARARRHVAALCVMHTPAQPRSPVRRGAARSRPNAAACGFPGGGDIAGPP